MKCKGNLEVTIDSVALNNCVQETIKKIYNSSDIQNRIMQYTKKKVDNYVDNVHRNGSIVKQASKRVAKEVDVNEILKLIDVDDLKNRIADKVAKHLISKM